MIIKCLGVIMYFFKTVNTNITVHPAYQHMQYIAVYAN